MFDMVEYLKELEEQLEHAPSCSHPGCYNHISHPCEGCGRIQGELPEIEKIRIREVIKWFKLPEKVKNIKFKYTKFTRFEIIHR